MRQSLFEPFRTSKPAGEGTGLGLYLCKMLAEMMKSKLELEQTSSQGTHFSLTFPLLEEQREQREQQLEKPPIATTSHSNKNKNKIKKDAT